MFKVGCINNEVRSKLRLLCRIIIELALQGKCDTPIKARQSLSANSPDRQ